MGPYEILAALGAGGMGEVYRARDMRLGREVAIKRLREKSGSDNRLFQEARAVSALNHPNILALHDICSEDGSEFLVINRLWIRALSETSSRQLPGTEDAQSPFWSPDGKTLGFFNGKELMRIDSDGSGLQSVTDTTSARGGAWLPDGRIVFGSYFNT